MGREVSATDGEASARVAGVSPAPLAGIAAIGVRAAMGAGFDLVLGYRGQLSGNQNQHAFTAGMRYRF